jgi:hypothetical protein
VLTFTHQDSSGSIAVRSKHFIGLPMTTPQRRLAATISNPPAHLLVLGIVTSEKTYTSRNRWLRAYYSDPLVNSGSAVLVRFVVDANWWARRIVEDPASASDDVLGVMTMSELPQRHCAHKMVGWWRAAARWPAAFYGKTDDDAAIDLPRLVPLLMQSLPRTRVYAGVVRYSSINESDWQGVCWAPGAGGALKLRRRDPACAASHVYGHLGERNEGIYGPFPFVEGPLVLMSADVLSWLAPKLAIDRRQLCHFEDLLLGRELSHRPQHGHSRPRARRWMGGCHWPPCALGAHRKKLLAGSCRVLAAAAAAAVEGRGRTANGRTCPKYHPRVFFVA